MKNNFLLLLVAISSISLEVNSQENILSMRILNKDIISDRDELLKVEIENLSDEIILLPLSTKSLNSYEYMNGYEKIVTESGSVNQILIGLRVVDSMGTFYTQIPSKGLDVPLNDQDGMFNEIDIKVNEVKFSLLQSLYKKNGFNEEQNNILEYDFLRKNLLAIGPKSKIEINYILNLRKFSIYNFNEASTGSPFEGGFEIKENGYFFYLELDLEKSFLEPYYIKLRKKRIINGKEKIFYGILNSNKIPIKVIK